MIHPFVYRTDVLYLFLCAALYTKVVHPATIFKISSVSFRKVGKRSCFVFGKGSKKLHSDVYRCTAELFSYMKKVNTKTSFNDDQICLVIVHKLDDSRCYLYAESDAYQILQGMSHRMILSRLHIIR